MQAAKLGDVSENRSNNLIFIRFLLATSIIFLHSFKLLNGIHSPDPFGQLTHGQTYTLGLAIHYFWLMSGFLVTASWIHRKGKRDYFARRALRLYPGVAVVSLFCIFIIAPISVADRTAYFHSLSVVSYIKALLVLKVPPLDGVFANVPHAGYVNEPLWSLAYQMRGYVLIAALGIMGAYRKRWTVLVAFAAAYIAYVAQFTFGWNVPHTTLGPVIGDVFHYPNLLTYYLAGATFYVYRDRIPYDLRLALLALAAMVLSCWAGLAIASPIAGSYLILFLAFWQRIPLQGFARGSDYSFGLYIYAEPIQQTLVQQAGAFLNPYTLFLAAFAGTAVMAAFSWHCVEKRFTKRKQTKPVRDAVAAPAPLPSKPAPHARQATP